VLAQDGIPARQSSTPRRLQRKDHATGLRGEASGDYILMKQNPASPTTSSNWQNKAAQYLGQRVELRGKSRLREHQLGCHNEDGCSVVADVNYHIDQSIAKECTVRSAPSNKWTSVFVSELQRQKLSCSDIWICLGLPMVLFVMPRPLSVGKRRESRRN